MATSAEQLVKLYARSTQNGSYKDEVAALRQLGLLDANKADDYYGKNKNLLTAAYAQIDTSPDLQTKLYQQLGLGDESLRTAFTTGLGADQFKNEKSGYYTSGDLLSYLKQGYRGQVGTDGSVSYTYIVNPSTGQVLRVKPGSGTTAASRAAAEAAGDPTLGYKNQELAAGVNQNVPVGATVNPDGTITKPDQAALKASTDLNARINAAADAGQTNVSGMLPQAQQNAYSQYFAQQAAAQGVDPRTGQPVQGQAGAQAGAQTAGAQQGVQQGGTPTDATLTGQQVGGRFGTRQFGRVGNDVYEIMSDGSRRKVTAAEFQSSLKAQGLNLDVLPQLDPNDNISDTPGGSAPDINADGTPKTTSQFVQDYQGIIKELGLTDIKKEFERVQKEYTDLQEEKLKAARDINNDPWLTEGVRVDRLRKLDEEYEDREKILTAKQQIYNTLYEQGIAEAKFLATGAQEDRYKMMEYALKVQEAENDLGLEPGIIGEYQYAVQNGYQGSFIDYQNEDANRKQRAGSGGLGALTNAQMNSTINQIVGAFDNEQLVKNYGVVLEGYNFVRSIPDTTTNPADDQALIYALAKALDPNSVVREGEYATAQKYAQSWIKAYGSGVKQAIAGTGFLSQEARSNIKKTIESRYLASKASYDNLYNEYQNRIKQVQGGGFNSLQDYSGAVSPQKQYTPGQQLRQNNVIYQVGQDGRTLTPIGSY